MLKIPIHRDLSPFLYIQKQHLYIVLYKNTL